MLPTIADVRDYWNHHIHDLEISQAAPGSPAFFADLDQYHFEKLHHLLRLVDFDGYRGKRVLDVGCGAGTDLVRFAKGGAIVSGVDLSRVGDRAGAAELRAAGARAPIFAKPTASTCRIRDGTFDLVFAHGVVQYTPDSAALVEECRRVLKPGGEAIFQVYNRISWLNALSKRDEGAARARGRAGAAQVQRRRVPRAAHRLPRRPHRRGALSGEVAPARRLEGLAFNTFFVGTFNALPRALVRRFGWHLLAFCRK